MPDTAVPRTVSAAAGAASPVAVELDLADGPVPVLLAEFCLVEQVVHQDERWLAAMARRTTSAGRTRWSVTVMVDVVTRKVFDVIDYVEFPETQEDGNFHLPEWVGQPDRQGLKPIEITQPDGPSFTIDEDGVLSWAGWKLQVSFDQREGLVFHNISINDAGVQRPVVYRVSIAEMTVPYGDRSPRRWFQNSRLPEWPPRSTCHGK